VVALLKRSRAACAAVIGEITRPGKHLICTTA
jgi:hypothetical protein